MKTVWKTLLVILTVVAVLAIVAEVALRWYIGDQITEGFRHSAAEQGVSAPADPDIDLGTRPLILGALGGGLPQVRLETPSTLQIERPDADDKAAPEVKGSPATHVDIRQLDLSDPRNPVAGRLTATTELTDDYLLAVVQAGLAESAKARSAGTEGGRDLGGELFSRLITVTDVTAVPDRDALDVEFTGGAAVLTLQPEAKDGALGFTVVGTSLFGVQLPPEISERITAALAGGVDDSVRLGGPLEITGVEVGQGTTHVTVTGHDVPLNELNSTQIATGTPA